MKVSLQYLQRNNANIEKVKFCWHLSCEAKSEQSEFLSGDIFDVEIDSLNDVDKLKSYKKINRSKNIRSGP